MALRSVGDMLDAFEAGRVWQQDFVKNAQGGTDGAWRDWSYIAGRPGFDARIGDALTLTPFVAVGNDAIQFPGIGPGMERRLAGMELQSNAGGNDQAVINYHLYDLLAVYPLIDGDSTDQQDMDNTAGLPRYADGDGVQMVIVNHVSPIQAAADGVMTYIDCAGDTQTVDIRVAPASTTNAGYVVTSTFRAGGAGGVGPLFVATAGCRGVRQVVSITWSTPPGGLFAIYLVRPLQSYTGYNEASNPVTAKPWLEKCQILHGGFNLPRILDGAWLGFFVLPSGGNTTFTLRGCATFIWG